MTDKNDLERAYSKGLANSLVGITRFGFLEEQIEQVRDLPGAVAEVGVYLGGTAKLLAAALAHKDIHLFDTFDGMPEVTAWDRKGRGHHERGDFRDAAELREQRRQQRKNAPVFDESIPLLDAVKGYLTGLDNIRFYPGLFPETAEALTEDKFCLVHVDVDIYESTKAVVEYFWPLLVPGGIMVFDDYNAPTCPGTNKAVDEFFKPLGLAVTPSGANKRCGTRIVKA